jgi:lysophospholipase L1-like esterase
MAAEVSAPAPRRRIARRLCLLGLTVALSLLAVAGALELLARCCWQVPKEMAHFQQQGMYDDDPAAGFGLRPGYRGTLQIQQSSRSIDVVIDGLGMRSDTTAPPDTRCAAARVLCVGDSVVFGYGVECAASLPAQVQRLLQPQFDLPVQVGNGGVPGHSTVDYVAHLRALLPRFPADLVVVAVYPGNDFQEDRMPHRAVAGGLFFAGPFARALQQSARVRFALRSRAWLWFECWLIGNRKQSSVLDVLAPDAEETAAFTGWPVAGPDFGRLHAGLFLDVRDEQTSWQAKVPPAVLPGGPPVVPMSLARLRESLTAARALCGSRPMLTLLLPTRWHCDPDAWRQRLAELGFDPNDFEFGAMRRRIAAVAADLGLPFADATEPLLGKGAAARFFIEDGGHLSIEGNAAVAAWLAPILSPRLRQLLADRPRGR